MNVEINELNHIIINAMHVHVHPGVAQNNVILEIRISISL